MNELVGESGANCREIEQEKTCKKQEDKNEVQADLLVQVSESGANRRRQVYPKKPRYNLLTPDQKKAANVQRKEKRVVLENSLTPDQLKDKKKAASVQRTEKKVAFENSLTPDQLKDKKKAASVQRTEK